MQKHASSGVAEPGSFFARISRQGRNYSTLVVWLLFKAFKGRSSKLLLAIVLSLIHLASQAAAIYAIYWYGRQMEQSGAVTIPYIGLAINLKEQPEWLWAIVTFSTLAFVVSASFLYLARRVILDVVEEHYGQMAEELVLYSLRLPDPRAKLASELFDDFGVGGLNTGCRRGAIIAISFANAITAVIGGLGAAGFLLWIDTKLTLLIFVSVGFAAILLYPLTLRAVRSAKIREKGALAFKLEVRKLAEDRPPDPQQTGQRVQTAHELSRAYLMRRRVLTELVFATEIGITIILGLVVYYLASEALAGREQWAIFIAYVGALRMTLGGISQAVRAFAAVSRYYPQIVRYYLFVKDMQKIDETSFAMLREGQPVIIGTLPNGSDIEVKAGDRLALVTSERMRDLQFTLINARATGHPGPIRSMILDPTKLAASQGGIALVAFFSAKDGGPVDLPREALKDDVTLIVYPPGREPGAFGETHMMTAYEGAFARFLPLGSEEAEAALKEIATKVNAMRKRKRGIIDSDEEDEDED